MNSFISNDILHVNIREMSVLIELYIIKKVMKLQNEMIKHYLIQLLRYENTMSNVSSHLKQIRILCHLIYEYENTLFVTFTKFEKSLILHVYIILTEKIII